MSGMNVDPRNLGGSPDPRELAEMGLTWVRMVARPGIEWYHDWCRGVGLRTLLVIAQESVLAAGLPYYATSFRPDAWQIGNEMDHVGESSWTMSPEAYRALWYSFAALTDVPKISGAFVSGVPEKAILYLDVPELAGVAVHPYNKGPREARELIGRYRALRPEVPLWVTEWNRPSWEIKDFLRMLHQETASHMWFCWSNAMVPSFGLDEPGKREAMQEAIMSLADEAKILEKRLEDAEDRNALTIDLIVRMLEGKWDGATYGAESAEALIRTISPTKYGNLKAVPFPKE